MLDICTNVPPLACENWVRDAVIPWLIPVLAGVVIFVVGGGVTLCVKLWHKYHQICRRRA